MGTHEKYRASCDAIWVGGNYYLDELSKQLKSIKAIKNNMIITLERIFDLNGIELNPYFNDIFIYQDEYTITKVIKSDKNEDYDFLRFKNIDDLFPTFAICNNIIYSYDKNNIAIQNSENNWLILKTEKRMFY